MNKYPLCAKRVRNDLLLYYRQQFHDPYLNYLLFSMIQKSIIILNADATLNYS